MRRVACVLAAVAFGVTATPAHAAERPDDPSLAKVFSLTNKARAKPQMCGSKLRMPAKRLRYDADLSVASQLHADDMAANNYFSHDSVDGRTFIERIVATDFSGSPAGENLASGQQTPGEVVRAWLDSPPHCRNLMAKKFDAVGLGLALLNDPQYSTPITFWVQDFGYDD
jgi:uncharacterized protein YkwD